MNKFVLHVCDNVRKEVEQSLQLSQVADIEIESFSSYCGHPPLKKEDLERIKIIDDNQIHLAVGSVCLQEIKQNKGNITTIITEENCFYFFLNNKLVDHYILDGAYLITPGWLINWKKHIDIWKFDQPTAREFFKESCKYLLFLDTGVYKNIEKYLTEFSEYIQIESKILPIGLDYFHMKLISSINEQINKIRFTESKEENDQAKRQVSEYAMALDMMGKLSNSRNEKEAIDNILFIMSMLFAPGKLFYLSYNNNKPDNLYDQSGSEIKNQEIRDRLSELKANYQWSHSSKGFCLTIKFQTEILGSLYIDDLAFPQYKEHYLNLGLFLSNMCGLAISNARSYQIVESQKASLVHSYEQLKESEQKYRLLFENMMDGFALHEIIEDTQGNPIDYRYLDINNAFENLTGLKKDEILFKKVTEVLPGIENDPSNWIEKYGRIAQKGDELRFEQYSEQLDKWFSILAFSPKRGQFATIFEDITANKTAEEEIRRTQEHIEVINRLLWHDITNSFTVLHSAIRIFKKTKNMDILEGASDSIQKGVDLIRRMRQLNETLTRNENLESITIQPLITQLSKDYNFPVKISGECTVIADGAITSVIDNLVSNTIHHAEASEIDIRLSRDGDKSIIEICDDGKGISDDFKEKVFEKDFFMGKTGNTGIGLYIVKKTIERYGGTIHIFDNKPKGTIFKISLNNTE